jgi:hypothetical protein
MLGHVCSSFFASVVHGQHLTSQCFFRYSFNDGQEFGTVHLHYIFQEDGKMTAKTYLVMQIVFGDAPMQ